MEVVRRKKWIQHSSVPAQADPLRILLISPNQTFSVSLANSLSEVIDIEFSLDQISTIEFGLARLTDNSYDIYFIDGEIARSNPAELLSRAVKGGCKRPIIYLSAVSDPESNREYIRAGALDYLVKGQRDSAELDRVIRLAIERRQSTANLEYHLRFEKLLTSIATNFINLPPEQIDNGISAALEQVGSYSGVDRAFVFQYQPSGETITMRHEWHSEGIEPAALFYREISATLFKPILQQVTTTTALAFSSLDELPLEASQLRELLQFRKVRSVLFVPLKLRAETVGILGFSSLKEERCWSDDTTALLEFVGQIIVNALERKRNGEELKQQKEFLSRVIDMTPNLVHVRDSAGRYVLVNPAMARTMGKSIGEVLGRTDQELGVPAEERLRRLEEDKRLLTSNDQVNIPEESFTDLSSSSTRWYRTAKYPISLDGHGNGDILTISTDLTERKRAEDALRKIVEGTASATAETFFRSLVQHLAEVLGTRYAFLAQVQEDNPKLAHTLAVFRDGKYFPNEAYPLADSPTEYIMKHQLQLYPENVQEVFPLDSFLKNEGIISYMGAPLVGADGKPFGILTVMDNKPMRDWPAGKWIIRMFAARAAAELDRLRMDSERGALQKQLLQAQKLEAIGQLAAGVAHDLNNALGAVVGHLQLLNIAARLEPEWKNSVNVALRGCERASSLIEQLLGFSRQGRYNLQTIEPQLVVRETLDFLSRVLEKNVRIEVTSGEGPLHICADAGQLQQALTNIILNAAQAMPTGGDVSIDIASLYHDSPARYNRRAKPGQFIRLSISDTGIGIPEENLEKIFEPFFTTKEHGKGSGLGLSMVYGIVQNHGGWIEAISAQNRGTTFSLYFPRAESKELAVGDDTENPTLKGSGTVMVIDDEEMLVDLTSKFLQRSGLTPVGFKSAKAAVEWFTANSAQIDMVVLDMKMPEMNGEACFLKLREIRPDIQVVILSGYTQDGHAHRLLSQGAIRFFQKPLKYPELMEWITNQLKGNRNIINQ